MCRSSTKCISIETLKYWKSLRQQNSNCKNISDLIIRMFLSPLDCISAVRTNVTIPIYPIKYYMEFNTAYFMKASMEHLACF